MDKYYFHIGDYRRKTAHLTNEEHGVYRWLIDEYFLTETPISTDLRMIMRKLRLTSDQKDTLEQILNEFFILEDDGWYHRHVEQVMARVHAKSEQSKSAINTRWENERKRRKANVNDTDVIRTNNEDDTDVIPTNNQKPITKNQKTTNGSKAPTVWFDEFWKAYPTDRRRDKKKAQATWARRKLDNIGETIVADVKNRAANDGQWVRGFIPMPTTYLNGDRWEDAIESTDKEKPQYGEFRE